jgi:two-component system response regulator DevR
MITRVFVLDDHELVRAGLRELLEGEADLEVVGESGSAQEAIRRIPALRPHVTLLDVRLPDGSGIEVCRAVRAIDPSIAVLVLTSYDDDDALLAAVVAGAAGFVVKDVRSSDLVRSIRAVAAGEMLIDLATRERARARLEAEPSTDPRLAGLTDQERRVLLLLAGGLTNRQIGLELFLCEKTVKNYVSRVLAKLGMQRRTQAAVFAASL